MGLFFFLKRNSAPGVCTQIQIDATNFCDYQTRTVYMRTDYLYARICYDNMIDFNPRLPKF